MGTGPGAGPCGGGACARVPRRCTRTRRSGGTSRSSAGCRGAGRCGTGPGASGG